MAKSNSQDPTLSAEPTYQKSGERQQSSLSYLANTVSKFEERRGDLVDRQHHLRDKITTMERSVPALMAFNMWLAAEKCEDAPLCKVKEIMNKFSPHPDPTEKLLENLANAVKNFTGETAELHDKIIATDIKLEESDMELESLELANKELEERVTELQEEVKKYTFPSLHSIHSEDLGCLTRIRQLGEAEAKLRNQVKDLEEKERLYNEQMTQILTSKEFQKASGTKKMTSRIQELELNSKKMHYALRNHKYNMHQMKKKLMQKDKELVSKLSHKIMRLS
ncbi:uncharacterized protein LOC105701131 [Orussus abietinus]|uniref:uncharacterized protein LOC105701131 n=1 Tax=Orussus abietinus TaxID=222816 RepID=UPI000C715C04|nr:uncharacterized protein LOC105701131 [Orussus abietinus]